MVAVDAGVHLGPRPAQHIEAYSPDGDEFGDEQFMRLVATKLEEKKEIPGPVLMELDPVLVKLLDNTFKDPKFDEVMRKYVLFKNSEGKLVTLEDYQASIPETYKEKLKDKMPAKAPNLALTSQP